MSKTIDDKLWELTKIQQDHSYLAVVIEYVDLMAMAQEEMKQTTPRQRRDYVFELLEKKYLEIRK